MVVHNVQIKVSFSTVIQIYNGCTYKCTICIPDVQLTRLLSTIGVQEMLVQISTMSLVIRDIPVQEMLLQR